jgi:adenylate cyclase class 2
LDVEVSDMEKTVEILKLSGIKFNRYQETLREEWEYEGALITIDTWPGLKPYVEIEAASEGEVKKIAEKMDFEWDKKIITAAAEVYSKVYGMDINKVLDKISDLTFENNPFSGMSMKWEGEKKD